MCFFNIEPDRIGLWILQLAISVCGNAVNYRLTFEIRLYPKACEFHP